MASVRSQSDSDSDGTLVTSVLIDTVLPIHHQERPAKILEFGSGHSDTIDFLQQSFWGRYTILSAIDDASEINQLLSQEEVSPVERDDRILETLEPALGQAYDLVLLWDFAAYFSESNLSWLDRLLDQFVTDSGAVHGFLCHNTTRHLLAKHWGVHDREHLICEDRSGVLPYQHQRLKFTRNLSSFAIEKSVLLKDGRLEVVLRRKSEL